jgi:hypothetical protein
VVLIRDANRGHKKVVYTRRFCFPRKEVKNVLFIARTFCSNRMKLSFRKGFRVHPWFTNVRGACLRAWAHRGTVCRETLPYAKSPPERFAPCRPQEAP